MPNLVSPDAVSGMYKNALNICGRGDPHHPLAGFKKPASNEKEAKGGKDFLQTKFYYYTIMAQIKKQGRI